MPLDFSDKNFVETCATETVGSTTIRQCYSSKDSFNEILLITFIFAMLFIGTAMLFNKRKK